MKLMHSDQSPIKHCPPLNKPEDSLNILEPSGFWLVGNFSPVRWASTLVSWEFVLSGQQELQFGASLVLSARSELQFGASLVLSAQQVLQFRTILVLSER